MSDYGQFKVGNTVFPLTTSLANSLLKDANPAVYYALEYFTAMLQTHLGDRWDLAVVAAGMPELVGKVVSYSVPYDPLPDLQSQQMTFPLLAVWEKESTTEQITNSWYHHQCVWHVSYTLPALTSAQKELLYPFLNAAKKVLVDRTEQGYDPAYEDGLTVWDETHAGIEKIQVSSATFGNVSVDPKTNLYLPALLLTLDVSIREGFDTSFLESFDGVDGYQLLDGYQFIQTEINLT